MRMLLCSSIFIFCKLLQKTLRSRILSDFSFTIDYNAIRLQAFINKMNCHYFLNQIMTSRENMSWCNYLINYSHSQNTYSLVNVRMSLVAYDSYYNAIRLILVSGFLCSFFLLYFKLQENVLKKYTKLS